MDKSQTLSKERQSILMLMEEKRKKFCSPINDMYNLTCERLSDSEHFIEYKASFYTLTNDFIQHLSGCKYNLTLNELYYCILFTILMPDEDIATCLGVKKVTVTRRKSEEVIAINKKKIHHNNVVDPQYEVQRTSLNL